MTERCENCRGTGRIDIQSRTYEYLSFSAECSSCDGAGMHRRAFGLDMRGERELNRCERHIQFQTQNDIDYNESWEIDKVWHAPFPDDFRIGQEKVARIRLEMSEAALQESMIEAFSTGYENEQWQNMRRRQFDAALLEYRRAQYVLSSLEEGVDLGVAA